MIPGCLQALLAIWIGVDACDCDQNVVMVATRQANPAMMVWTPTTITVTSQRVCESSFLGSIQLF
ncbi:hypothetical protein NY99_20350 [Xanthomonas phaseoli pv. phaseoli]|nr:hypothetical protein NY99_20350 [Xanthomonas phaseoli pv. phaseoli]KHS05350.2 hypothetical protein RM61_21895 [Xanthomonas phaseoli pv. phaseoli]KHS22294.2 hypothetical protein RM60_21105 [Xanthomonas phaseoli pv. phaseoli]